ncbi:MAG TPA: hypothetical protein VGE05_03325 [Novosphingobium sp.]
MMDHLRASDIVNLNAQPPDVIQRVAASGMASLAVKILYRVWEVALWFIGSGIEHAMVWSRLRLYAGISRSDIGSIQTLVPRAEVVCVRGELILDEYQLVPGTIECAHTPITLRPNAQI